MAEEKVEVLSILISEAVRDTLAWIVAHGRMEDFYRILAPCLSQIGIDAPADLATNGKDVGDLAMHLAIEGQRLFMQRMGVAKAKMEAHRKWKAEWRAAHLKRPMDGQVDSPADGQVDSPKTVGIGKVNNPTDTLTNTNTEPLPNTVPNTVPEKGGNGGKGKAEVDPDFVKFWEAYGHKVKKAAAEAAFAKARKSPTWPGIDAVIAAVEAWRKSDQWTKSGGQFQPHAATWLNGCQWDDEPPAAAPAQDKGVPPGLILHQEGEGKIREDF